MSSSVYFTDLRAGSRENLHTQLARLADLAGLKAVVSTGDLTAIKLHFGEKGGHAYIRPTFVQELHSCIDTTQTTSHKLLMAMNDALTKATNR